METTATESFATHHTDMVHDAQLDYYGKLLATCSSDSTIKIFDVGRGKPRHICDITGHEGPVWQVSWGHPKFGVILASCSYDRTVRIWRQDPANAEWNCVHICRQMKLSVNGICWAPHEHGLILAAGSSDGSIWTIEQRGDRWTESLVSANAHSVGVTSVSWRPVVAYGALSSTSSSSLQLISGGCDNVARIWTFNGEWTTSEKNLKHHDWVRDVAWAPNIGIPYDMIATCSQDGRVIIWKKLENEQTWKETQIPLTKDAKGETVWKVSWSITGSILAVSSGENKVTLWKESLDPEPQGSDRGKWVCISRTGGESS